MFVFGCFYSSGGQSGWRFGCAVLNAGSWFNLSSIAVIMGYGVKSTLNLNKKIFTPTN